MKIVQIRDNQKEEAKKEILEYIKGKNKVYGGIPYWVKSSYVKQEIYQSQH